MMDPRTGRHLTYSSTNSSSDLDRSNDESGYIVYEVPSPERKSTSANYYALLEESKSSHQQQQQPLPQETKPLGRIYLFWSFIGSLFHCMSMFVRGIESADPWSAKFTLSLSNLLLGIIALAIYRLRLGKSMRWPWLQKVRNSGQNEYRMSKSQIAVIVIAGSIEFIGGSTVLLCLNESQRGNINLGIGSSISTVYTVFAAGLSYYFFKERVTLVQLLGIFVLIGACATISCTGKDDNNSSSTTGSMIMVTVYAIIIAIAVAIESTLTKWLRIRHEVPGDITGIFIMFVDGVLGTICLIVTTC